MTNSQLMGIILFVLGALIMSVTFDHVIRSNWTSGFVIAGGLTVLGVHYFLHEHGQNSNRK